MDTHPNYELFEELGSGGNTIVYRGYDLSLNREVAIKQLQTAGREDPQRTARFLKEAQFLAQFEHENILRIYSVDADRGWIIMERMNGPLSQQMTRPLAPQLVRSILRQMLMAISFLHRKDKIHGAVRPGNLLINDDGLVKLSDFEEVTPDGELRIPRISAKYMAPELLDPKFGPFGKSVDLYCLGFSTLEMLRGPSFDDIFPGTGEGAIDAETAWLRWHSSSESLVPVRDIDATIPDDLADVLDRMLQKQVDRRAQSAEELLKRLDKGPLVRIQVSKQTDEAPQSAEYMANLRELGPALTTEQSDEQLTPEVPIRKVAEKQKPSAPKFSRERLNEYLSKPWVLYPVCAGIMAVALLFVLQPNQAETTSNEPEIAQDIATPQTTPSPIVEQEVTIVLSPADLILSINDDAIEIEEGQATISVEEGNSIAISAESNGFESFSSEYDWEALAETEFALSITLEPTGPDLPDGLVADPSSPIDTESGLPLYVLSTALEESAPMRFRLIPAGEYTIENWNNTTAGPTTKPRSITLAQPLYVSTQETSLAQYAAFYRSQGAFAAGESWLEPARKWINNFNVEVTESQLPATNMSTIEAESFCQWVGGRLPTEAEWEAATAYLYYGEANEFATPSAGENSEFRLRTAGSQLVPEPTDQFLSGSIDTDVLHLIGNVAERCSDDYGTGSDVVKGCSYLIPAGEHVHAGWRSPGLRTGEWDVGIRVVVGPQF